MTPTVETDVAILGGGGAGLWLLDAARRRGHACVLLEHRALGAGQTICAQGIMHGGLKYALSGLATKSARSIRDMPGRWRRCLGGEEEPDLRNVRVLADACCMWRTRDLSSRFAMLGAKASLRTHVAPLPVNERPAPLRGAGEVIRVDEQVIDPQSLVAALAARCRGRVVRIDAESGLEIDRDAPDGRVRLRLIDPDRGEPLDLLCRRVVFTAGGGNAELRRAAGLGGERMQRRPLHMLMVRGDLPAIHGHCVDGMQTRMTITSTRDAEGRTVWQLGGQVAEDGVDLDAEALIEHGRRELAAVLPDLDQAGLEWASYRVDRAEASTRGHARPGTLRVLDERPFLTAWPTKLVLVPALADAIVEVLPEPAADDAALREALADWPVPPVAAPPWEEVTAWTAALSA